jgi:hypothetical protein
MVITVNNVPSAAVQACIVASQPGIFTIPATGQGKAILTFLNPDQRARDRGASWFWHHSSNCAYAARHQRILLRDRPGRHDARGSQRKRRLPVAKRHLQCERADCHGLAESPRPWLSRAGTHRFILIVRRTKRQR